MNRHRQERETETLNRARQLVFGNDNLIQPTPPHHLLGGHLPISHGGYSHLHHQASHTLKVSGYPPAARYYCGSSSSSNIPPPESYMYPSAPRQLVPYPPSHYNINPPINDYFVGHAVPSTAQLPSYNTTHEGPAPPLNNYTCIGAPVGRRFVQGIGEAGRDTSSTVPNNNNNNYESTSNNNNNNEEDEGGENEESS
ncbi:zinc finger protein JAGGED-like isoform X2 [Apium graveolens]